MTIREKLEQRERSLLADWATLSTQTRGRAQPLTPCENRTEFQRDRDRIIHSKSFRRLAHKTQVFVSPEGDHYRARLTHTLEVAQIGRTIARALDLNEDLAEAIALGHDLGHTPFGHAGERALNKVSPFGFRHNEQSLRVVDRLEGLNLTWEVRDGILCHTGQRRASTPEGCIIHYADRIAYINHDIDDAIRGGIIKNEDIPERLLKVLGRTHGQRIDRLVISMIGYGERHHEIGMEEEILQAMLELRTFMFDNVYLSVNAKGEEERAQSMLGSLYRYYVEHPDELPEDYQRLRREGDSDERAACDYIACMTDRYSIAAYRKLFIPKSWNRLTDA